MQKGGRSCRTSVLFALSPEAVIKSSSLQNVSFPTVALVIQGQVISRGRLPVASMRSHEMISENDIVTFDASDNIRQQIKIAKKLFGAVSCVTWKTEDCSRIADLVDKGDVVQAEDTTRFLPGRTPLLPSNNKSKQFLSTLIGVQDCIQKNPALEFAIKVRTDQLVDLELLAESVISHRQELLNNKSLIVPAFMPNMTNGLHDFYFGGSIQAIREICDSFVDEQGLDFCTNVHTDFFARIATSWLQERLGVASYSYYLRDGAFSALTPEQSAIALAMWGNVITTFPRKAWENVIWRGQKLHRAFFPDNLYSDDTGSPIDAHLARLKKSSQRSESRLRNVVRSLPCVNWTKWIRRKFHFIPSWFDKAENIIHLNGLSSHSTYTASLVKVVRLLTPPLAYRMFSKKGEALSNASNSGFDFYATDQNSLASLCNDYFGSGAYFFESPTRSPRIIDCGANIGVSVRYWKQIYPGAKVVAFECDPGHFEMLQLNTQDLADVKCFKGAVWTSSGECSFLSNGREGGHLLAAGPRSDAETEVTVRTFRLRDFLTHNIDLLKIDIEGAEVDVLKDCRDRLHNVQRLFVEHHSFVGKQQRLTEFFEILEEAGFRIYINTGSGSIAPFAERTVFNNKDLHLNVFAYRDMQ